MHIIMTTDFDFEKLTMLLGLISGVTWMVISLLLQNHISNKMDFKVKSKYYNETIEQVGCGKSLIYRIKTHRIIHNLNLQFYICLQNYTNLFHNCRLSERLRKVPPEV